MNTFIIFGGCWDNFNLKFCRTDFRTTYRPSFRTQYIGFRLTKSLKS